MLDPETVAAWGTIVAITGGAAFTGLAFYVRSVVGEKEAKITATQTRVEQIASDYDRRLTGLDEEKRRLENRIQQVEKDALTRFDRQEMLGAIKNVGDGLSQQIQDLRGDVTHLIDRVSRVEAAP